MIARHDLEAPRDEDGLLGRSVEIDAIKRLLDDAREERSGALVLHAEAGVGKTALLDHVVAHAAGFRVVRVLGVESEVALPYGALHQLCGPMLGRIDRLPTPQRAALEVAFGLDAGPRPEPLLVGLATLSVLADAALEEPLLCVCDDAQWLDQPSAQALAFVARRLLADPVVLLFATREMTRELAGLPELDVHGLAVKDARALLASVVKGPLDERVRDRIVAEANGNPLALLELPRGLSALELAIGLGVPRASPVSTRIEDSFRRRLDALPDHTGRLLLLAAVEPLGDATRVWAAARLLGVPPTASAAAEAAGLLDVGEEIRFRHPLVRSAVYRGASPQERRAAHRALATVTDPEGAPDCRAWHLAQAATGPDEPIAAALERAAGRAQERGGLVAAAALLELSAQLTPDDHRQAERRLLAAETQLMAGATERAQELLEQSLSHLDDPGARAVAMRMEGAIRFADGRGGDTPALLFDAALSLGDANPARAREWLMESMETAMWAGRLTSRTTTFDVARAASEVETPADDAPASVLLTGYTKRFTEGYVAAVPWWRRAIAAFDALEVSPHLQWHGMIWNATGETLDFDAHRAVARRWARHAREQGALATLPVALSGLGWSEMLAGRVHAAESLLSESLEMAAATGAPAVPGANEILRMGILYWRGEDDPARLLGDAIVAEAVSRGQGLGVTIAHYGRTILELGHGRYESARTYALSVFEEDVLYFGTINLADVIEATVRSGDLDSARAALARLAVRAEATMTPWGLGLLARGRALLADGAEAEPLYKDSLAHLQRSGVATEQARTRLLYGEWLRRQRRRRDARAELLVAHEMLQGIGAGAFAQRARTELLATGERARARVPDTRDQLTPQERQVALLAAEGETNAAIGAQLFISHHTVAYHLRKVFGKLGVSSRSQLAGAVVQL